VSLQTENRPDQDAMFGPTLLEAFLRRSATQSDRNQSLKREATGS